MFNVNSYAEYMASVQLQLYLIRSIIEKSINLSHTCHGDDIYSLNPNKPMFSITPVEKNNIKK